MPGGRELARARTAPGRAFALRPPTGFEGGVIVSMEGRLRSAKTGKAWIGDAAGRARDAAARARASLASMALGPATVGYDPSASLGFLADLLEGKTADSLEGFDAAFSAMMA